MLVEELENVGVDCSPTTCQSFSTFDAHNKA